MIYVGSFLFSAQGVHRFIRHQRRSAHHQFLLISFFVFMHAASGSAEIIFPADAAETLIDKIDSFLLSPFY